MIRKAYSLIQCIICSKNKEMKVKTKNNHQAFLRHENHYKLDKTDDILLVERNIQNIEFSL